MHIKFLRGIIFPHGFSINNLHSCNSLSNTFSISFHALASTYSFSWYFYPNNWLYKSTQLSKFVMSETSSLYQSSHWIQFNLHLKQYSKSSSFQHGKVVIQTFIISQFIICISTAFKLALCYPCSNLPFTLYWNCFSKACILFIPPWLKAFTQKHLFSQLHQRNPYKNILLIRTLMNEWK